MKGKKMQRYNIAIVSDEGSWFAPFAEELVDEIKKQGHAVSLLPRFDREKSYDFVFLLSCSELIPEKYLRLNKHNLVAHASRLPQGKGWSPMTWQILAGKDHFPVTLFEAVPSVDAGPIYIQKEMHFEGTELVDDLRNIMGDTINSLCLKFINGYPHVLQNMHVQFGEESFYPRRRPDDSRLDIDKTIKEQMNLLRVVDNERYPAFFEWRGQKYILTIRKSNAPVAKSNVNIQSSTGGGQPQNSFIECYVCYCDTLFRHFPSTAKQYAMVAA